jgi:hypothetical protein
VVIARARQSAFHDGHPGVEQSTDPQSAGLPIHLIIQCRGSGAAAATQALPNVDSVYTRLRLAQRVPVRIAIDNVPPGVPLVSGLTATVTIREARTPRTERSCKGSAPNSRRASSD